MAKEIQYIDVMRLGGTQYAYVKNQVGQWWNTSGTPAFEAFNASNWTSYAISATQFGSSGEWYADMPAVPAGLYNVTARYQSGGSPAQSDTPVAEGQIDWDGSAVRSLSGVGLAATGLDAISATAPDGVASTFPAKLMQIWQRFFGKIIKDISGGVIKTYKPSNAAQVATTQAFTDTAAAQGVDVAS